MPRQSQTSSKVSNASDLQTGTIKRLVRDRGFGFVEAGGFEYFFHRSECAVPYEQLTEGQRVSFVIDPTNPKGPRASQVGPA